MRLLLKYQFLLLGICFLFARPSCLKAGSDSIPKLPENSIFVEWGGNGLVYSLNYERILLQRGRLHLGARAGVSAVPDIFSDNFYIKYPCELNAFFGKKNNFFETGLGHTWDMEKYEDYVRYDGLNYEKVSYRSRYAFLRLGYRMYLGNHRTKFVVRVAVLPYLNYKPGYRDRQGKQETGPDQLTKLGLSETGGFKYEYGCWGGVSVGLAF